MNFEVKYFVNEEKKIVVAKMVHCYSGLACDMCKKGYPTIPDFTIPDSFVGKAKCSPEDTFDVETGKKIAFKRAYKKYVAAKKKVLTAFAEENRKSFDDFFKTVGELVAQYDRADTRRTEEIKELIGNAE